ncbi:MAG: DUF4159 domain-containing protein [Gemmatimonadetes bacterium]|nr:DUF4159 domain-containing protein [Gemmatimonadota bacterium]
MKPLLALMVATAVTAVLGAEVWSGRDGSVPGGDAPTEVAATGIAAASVADLPEAFDAPLQEQPPYDGRVTFVRIEFSGGGGGRGFRGFGQGPPWSHDWPRADRNFSSILGELTSIDTDAQNHIVLRMDDPEVFKYPLIYAVEVGYWNPSRAEIDALSAYLQKGGFLIVDDFQGQQIYQLQAILAEALPGAVIDEVPDDHAIFDSFYFIEDPHSLIPPYGGSRPLYLGVFEDNDPSKRLMAIFNYNNDIAEYWEYSDRGFYPVDLSNEAYQFGVNYLMYALTR